MSQLSLFSAEALPPALDDLEGLLAGPGRASLSDGSARVSVLVSDDWRVEPMLTALERLGLPGEVVTTPEGVVVRTPFTGALVDLAQRWTSGAVKLPPPGLVLDGPRLRWWCLAAGTTEGGGYLLRLGDHDEEARPALGAALSGAGLAAVYLPEGGGGPAYKVVGAKRLRRLVELVGDPPHEAPDGAWPTT